MTENSKSGASKWLGGIVVLVLAYFGIDLAGGDKTADPKDPNPAIEQSSGSGTATGTTTPAKPDPAKPAANAKPEPKPKPTRSEAKPEPKPQPKPEAKPERKSVMVRGPNGRRLDIWPTIDRIQRGEKHSHRNDGSVFQNRERRLPRKQRGYYREYVHPTPGRRGPGAQRLVIGKAGEIYYTPDHYESFQRVSHTFEKGGR